MTDYERIYLEYGEGLRKYIYSLTRNENILDDLVQDTFYQAYISSERYNGECKYFTWLCQIAKHLYYDYLKKCKKYSYVDFEMDVNEASDINIEDKVIEDEKVKELRRCIEELENPYKEVVLLRIYAEYDFKKIGSLFHNSDVWARVTFYRAKQKMKERMKANENTM